MSGFDLTGVDMDSLGLERSDDYGELGLERDKPELTIDRALDVPGEAFRKTGRAYATSARSHFQHLYRDPQDPDFLRGRMRSDTKLDMLGGRPGDEQLFHSFFYQHPDLATALEQRVAAGEDPESVRWAIARDFYTEKRDRVLQQHINIEESKALESPPEFHGQSSGFIEDIFMGVFGSLPDMLPTMVNPALGVPFIYGHMQGAMHEELERASQEMGLGLDETRLFQASAGSALINTPLELIGELFQIRGIMGSGWFASKLGQAAEVFGGESLTEFAQNWPEEVAMRWALNPDLDAVTLTDHIADTITDPRAWADAGYEGLVGGMAGLVTAGTGHLAFRGLDRLVHPKQKAINETRLRQAKELVNKPLEEMSEQDKVDLLALAGLDPEKVAEQDQAKIDEIVTRVKGRLLFQAEPIQSAEKDELVASVSKNLTPEQANQVMSMWDGIARVATEQGLVDKPEDFYKQWIAEVRKGKAAEFATTDQGILNQAPANDPVHQVVADFNEQIPGHQIEYDGMMDLSAIGKPSMYQFTPYDGPAKGATFMTASPDVDAVKAKLNEMIAKRAPDRVLYQSYAEMHPRQQKEIDEFVGRHPQGDRIFTNLQVHQGTPWENLSSEAVLIRKGLEDLLAGKTDTAALETSYLSNTQVRNVVDAIRKNGRQGLWGHLRKVNFIGHAAKPVNSINSSYLNCDPSPACAKYCYATKGNYAYANPMVKSELVDLAISQDPRRAARQTANEYKLMAEYDAGKALRLFDKGDLAEHWIPFINELNAQGVRVQVFSKRPELLSQLGSDNVRLLSIDESNRWMADEHPDLGLAVVYSGKQDLEWMEAHANQVQVILPIRMGRRVLSKDELTGIPRNLKRRLCPVDTGTKTLANWNCTKCDASGGIGCFAGQATKQLQKTTEYLQLDAIAERVAALEKFAQELPNGTRREAFHQELDLLVSEIRGGIDPGAERISDEEVQREVDRKRGVRQDARGAVEYLFDNTPKIIHLFENADASTLIHETGHILLEMLYRSGSSDYQVAAAWTGVDPDRAGAGTTAWTTDEHERFAKAFELYMMEGRAPTMRLHGVFQRIKTYLLDIYRKVSNEYFQGIEVKPELRELFDRWLATDQERALDPFFEVAEWYKTEDLQAFDQAMVDRAMATTGEYAKLEYDDIVAKARGMVAARRAERWARIEKQLDSRFRKEAEDIVANDLFYEMIAYLHKHAGLAIKSLRDLYDQNYINDVLAKRPGLFREAGEPVDTVANEWGYDTTDDLINDLLNRPSKGAAIERAYNDLWAEYETSSHLDHIDDYEESIELEIEIINELLGKKKPKARTDLKRIIREQTGQVTRQDPDARRLREDLARDAKVARDAWREAAKLTREIERDKSNTAKRAQLEKVREQKLAAIVKLREEHRRRVATIREDYRKQKEREKIFARLNRKLRQKTMLPDYRGQIANFLGRYIKIPAKFKGLPAVELEQFVRGKLADESVSDSFFALFSIVPEARQGKPLTLEELETIGDIVDFLAHMELNERKQRLIDEKETIQRAADEMVDSIVDTFPAPKADTQPAGLKDLKWTQRFSESWFTWFAELKKPEYIIRALDGWKDFGPSYRHIFEPIKKAEDAEMTMGDEYLARLKELWSKFDRKWATRRYQVVGIEGTISKEKMIMIALNSGNVGNRTALMHGNGISEQSILDIIDQLTEKEKELVVKTWELIDALFPELDRVHRKLTGVRLRKVEGRYFPLKFDPRESWRAGEFAADEQLRDMFANQYIWARVEAGHRVERKGGKLPVRLDFGVIHEHITKVLHDVTHQVPVRNVQKLLHNPRFRNTVQRWVGRETYAQLTPWLQHVARSNPMDPDGMWGKLAGRLRRNATVVALGLKVSVALQQVLSLTQTMDAIGFADTVRGVAQFYKHPTRILEQKALIDELSPFMAHRDKNWDRELAAMYKAFDPKAFGWTGPVKDSFFYFVSLVDKMAVYPSWLGAYQKALDQDKPQAKAVEYADMIVRTTQPAGSPKDMAAIQRGSEFKKLATMFYSFFSVFQNQMMEINTRVRVGNMSIPKAMGSFFYLVIAPAVLGYVISERDIPDWRDVLASVVRYRLGGIPFVRDLVSAFTSDYGYSLSPVEGLGKRADYLYNELAKVPDGDADWMRIAKESIHVGGYLTGLPSGQMVIAMDGALDLAEGRTKNPLRLIFREKREKKK